MVIKWLLLFVPAVLVEILCWWLTPIVCLFVVKREHTDKVKRRSRLTVTLQREFLPKWLSLFGTPDNAVDEYFWGMYNEDSIIPALRNCSEAEYLSSWWMRYFMRCMWLFRNTAYGFHYAWFSVQEEPENVKGYGEKRKGLWYRLRSRKSSFQLQYQLPIPFTSRYIDGNIGWKGHDGDDLPLLMYANRVIGLRRYKDN